MIWATDYHRITQHGLGYGYREPDIKDYGTPVEVTEDEEIGTSSGEEVTIQPKQKTTSLTSSRSKQTKVKYVLDDNQGLKLRR